MQSRWAAGRRGRTVRRPPAAPPAPRPPTALSPLRTASPRPLVSSAQHTVRLVCRRNFWKASESTSNALTIAARIVSVAEEETSSRHRPLPTPDDPILPSPMRFPLPTSIGATMLRFLLAPLLMQSTWFCILLRPNAMFAVVM